jgi:pimeloyl-ACP methyl ester carboxylesterase
MLGGSPERIAESLASLLCPPDLACLTGDLAQYFYDQIAEALRDGVNGWVEDDFGFVEPWGFEFDEIKVPVQVWHGAQDQFVPVAHGQWLAERIPGAEEHVYAEDGHLTLQIARIGDVHAWLAKHF